MASSYEWQGQTPFKYMVKLLSTKKPSEKAARASLCAVLGEKQYSKLSDFVYHGPTSGVQFSCPTAEDARQTKEAIKRLLPNWNFELEGTYTQTMKLNKRTYNKMKSQNERDFKIISQFSNIEINQEIQREEVHVTISGYDENDIRQAKETIEIFYRKCVDSDAVAEYASYEPPTNEAKPMLKPKPSAKKAASDIANAWRHSCVHMESNYGTNVMVYKGDITTLKVDIVVNAANGYMGHGGGVAAAISQAAGPALEQQCLDKLQELGEEVPAGNYIVTTAGKMPSKKVIHAVAPRYTEYTDAAECLRVLYETIYVSLQYANQNKFNSIALPALGSGIFGIPKEDVAHTMCHVVADVCSRQTSLKQIHLIDIDDDMIELFKKKILGKAELTFEHHLYNSATKRKKPLHPGCPL